MKNIFPCVELASLVVILVSLWVILSNYLLIDSIFRNSCDILRDIILQGEAKKGCYRFLKVVTRAKNLMQFQKCILSV